MKKECPTYLKEKGKVFTTTLSDSDSSKSGSKESYDGEGNYFAFMTIAPVDSSEDLSNLVEELGEHTEVESISVGDEFDDEKKNASMKEQIDCKNPTMHFLRRVENILKWLRQPLER